MKEKPILFSGEMVRAILEGRKTQTRRVIKKENQTEKNLFFPKCPYGQPGDRLWVRETWATIKEYDNLKPSDIPKGDARWPHIWYYAPKRAAASAQNSNSQFLGKKRPSIFMPRWASRTTLEVTGVRVERVQEISEDDCYAEGIGTWMMAVEYASSAAITAKDEFRTLWDSINAARGFGWDTNPWVWVVEFEMMEAA